MPRIGPIPRPNVLTEVFMAKYQESTVIFKWHGSAESKRDLARVDESNNFNELRFLEPIVFERFEFSTVSDLAKELA